MQDKFLSFSEVQSLAGQPSRTTLWRWAREGKFPKPIQIGPNKTAWLESEVQNWISEKVTSIRNSGDEPNE